MKKKLRSSDKYRVSQGPRSGVAAIIGKWPGGETDDEIAEALRKAKVGAMSGEHRKENDNE